MQESLSAAQIKRALASYIALEILYLKKLHPILQVTLIGYYSYLVPLPTTYFFLFESS